MDETTKDLRSDKQVGRPSNTERSSGSAIKETIHLLTADLLKSLRKEVNMMTPNEKSNLLGKLLQYVADDEQTTLEDASFNVLAEKYLKIECRIKGVGGKSTPKSAGTSQQTPSKSQGSSARKGSQRKS